MKRFTMVIFGMFLFFPGTVVGEDSFLVTVSTSGYVNRPAEETEPASRELHAIKFMTQLDTPFQFEVSTPRRVISVNGIIRRSEDESIFVSDLSYSIESSRSSFQRFHKIQTEKLFVKPDGEKTRFGNLESLRKEILDGVSTELKSRQSYFISVARGKVVPN